MIHDLTFHSHTGNSILIISHNLIRRGIVIKKIPIVTIDCDKISISTAPLLTHFTTANIIYHVTYLPSNHSNCKLLLYVLTLVGNKEVKKLQGPVITIIRICPNPNTIYKEYE